MEQVKIENTVDNYFKEAWDLYEHSFPVEERRQLDSQVKLFRNEKYNFDVIIKEGEFFSFGVENHVVP